MRTLSKSKLLAFRQCPKRLWLTLNKKDLLEDSAATKAAYRTGHEVGEVARRLYDPTGKGTLLDPQSEGVGQAIERTQALLTASQPVFEAGFEAGGARAFADVMLPARKSGMRAWRMVEVKASGSVKDYHRDDVAIQAFVARAAGVPLASVALAHLDTAWVYPGGGDYDGLLTEQDLTDEAFAREDEVVDWITQAQKVAAKRSEPTIRTGHHCTHPYECGFRDYCQSQEPRPEYPVEWLPSIATKALKAHIADDGITELHQVRDDLLNDRQLRVKQHTLTGTAYFDAAGAAADLAPHKLPAVFLDFETTQFAVPIWKGTRPYQQIPFQFSIHRLARMGKLTQVSFLDLSGKDPSRRLAEALIDACGSTGPVFAFKAEFEMGCIKALAVRFPQLREALLAINNRIVDLLPIARQRYYHPDQEGSWSIKNVLPTISSAPGYDALEGIQDGGLAMEAYREAIAPETTPKRKAEIEQQLLAYCRLDTYAMVLLWAFFMGRTAPKD